MFAKRIIPCLDIKEGRVVKGVNFVGLRDAGDPVECAKAYEKAGADEIVFLDITATSDDRKTVVDLVRRVTAEVFVPITVVAIAILPSSRMACNSSAYALSPPPSGTT